ncbi:ABC transporter substrate-binding protein [Paenibacillus oceani]|uniref:Extracellular solute-binding protein n=1 Tax=Paenibacillus oceani TaxID=2772510 RepID=A0A927CBY9_9BACL|nr:extracellular solute-binding protein [Paenibacillus oceani]MBD2863080.1 extracellular solute-binding protein [Paenibacillus oceani]
MLSHKKIATYGTVLLAVSIALSGCSQSGSGGTPSAGTTEPGAPQNVPELNITEPVTVKLYSHYAAINNQNDLNALFSTVNQKHPNIKIELIKGITLNDMIAAGEVPDLIATTHFYMNGLLPLGVASDLNAFVKTYKVDLGQFEPQAVNAVKSYGKNGELYGIPYTLNYGVLLYNKEIFNKFGVPFPKDGMTWEEAIDLGKRLTRKDGETQFIGLDLGTDRTLARGYSLGTVDKQGKAAFDSDGYKKMFGLMKSVYEIPGMIGDKNKYTYGVDYLIKDQKLAMFPSWLAAITSRLKTAEEGGQTFDWDVAGHPVFSDKPGVGREIEFQSLMVPPTAKNKEAAYRVILTMIGEESQEVMNKDRNLTILNKPELRTQYASTTNIFKNKNLSGVFSVRPAEAPIASEYDSENYKYLREATESMIFGGVDINSALRTANEKANKHIEEVKTR